MSRMMRTFPSEQSIDALQSYVIVVFPLIQGIPLHLQIDTYEDIGVADAEPIHRAFCQIKIFRDKVSSITYKPHQQFNIEIQILLITYLKGAERKNKDESRSAEKRMQKLMKQNNSSFSGIVNL